MASAALELLYNICQYSQIRRGHSFLTHWSCSDLTIKRRIQILWPDCVIKSLGM